MKVEMEQSNAATLLRGAVKGLEVVTRRLGRDADDLQRSLASEASSPPHLCAKALLKAIHNCLDQRIQITEGVTIRAKRTKVGPIPSCFGNFKLS